jgi:uncharacterized protein (PEP-CTERM system associated)
VLATIGTPAAAQSWHFVPSVALDETLTNNVNLQPPDSAKADLVTVITPSLAIDEKSAHTTLRGTVALPVALYAKTGDLNNKVYPLANLVGNVDVYNKFFQVDAEANVTQQYSNPFGPQPTSLAYATNNRYTAAFYRVSPFIQGTTPTDIKYELRNNNVWTNLGGAPISTSNSYTNEWLATVTGPLRTFGWAVDGDYNNTKFTDQSSQIQALGRARLLWQPDPQIKLNVSGGYEDNRFPFADYTGAIYGVGGQWTPTERMKIVGNWEHRYFGSSYLASFENRTPLSVVTLQASRNTTSYPQQLFTLPPTGSVAGLLFLIFATKIPDPLARLDFVEQFIANQGLPSTLSTALPVYNQQISLQENATATFGLLGARNSIFLNVYYLRQEPITGSGQPLPAFLFPYNNNTQSGVSVDWAHRLTPQLTLDTMLTLNRTKSNDLLPEIDPSFKPTVRWGSVFVKLSAYVSPQTTVYAGARYQRSRGYQLPTATISTGDFNEAAAVAGITYTFR